MVFVLLIGTILSSISVNFFAKQYNEKTKHYNLWLFSGMTMLGVLIFFLVQAGFQIRIVKEIIPISVIFTIAYAATMVGSVLALQKGPFSITMLIHSYSLFPPVLFYLIVLKERISVLSYFGIGLLLLSLLFLREKKVEGSFSWGWLFWVVVSFAGNSVCAIMMKMQQVKFDGRYKNEMMIYAMLVLAMIFFAAGILKIKNGKAEMVDAAFYGLPRGAMNGISTLLSLLLLELIPASIAGPLTAGGDIVMAFILAVGYYHEKLSKSQLVGYLFGTISVIFLNM